jgi:hypothetical protein
MKLSDIHSPARPDGSKQTALHERHQKVAAALAAPLERLNKHWKEAEKKLTTLVTPRHVWISYDSVPADPSRPDEYQIHSCMGLVRYHGEWRICLGSYYDAPPDDEPSWKPINECSADERVAAAPHLLKLREKIISSAEEFVAKVDEANRVLVESLKQL